MAHNDNITTGDGWFVGEDKDLVCTVYDADPDASDAAPQPITGWQFSFLLKRRVFDADAEAVIEKRSTGPSPGIELTDPANGQLTVSIGAADTRALPPGTYHYQVKRTDVPAVIALGTAVLRPSLHQEG